MVNDAHCHFFSGQFLATLGRQRGRGDTIQDLCRELEWDDPGEPETLADRWVTELDAHGVSRAAIIASVPGDESSVAAAVARYPERLVGYFMVNAGADDAVDRTRTALDAGGLRTVCLFPSMHHVALDDSRTLAVVGEAADNGAAVFVHCGVLTVGVRKKLGLPSPFDLRLGDPLALARLAAQFPSTPFIVPHFGAGRFREALMAAVTCANVYFDTSSSNGWVRYHPGLTMAGALRAALAVMGPSRLLFGTDSSFFPRGWQRAVFDEQTRALDELGVSTADRELIMAGNFDRIFGSAGGRE
jgi:predicted TIM-barrel fold metal-dependent hydrolase